MGQRYKKCPFLKILSALIMKSIIGVCQFSFQNPSFLIEFLPLFCAALLSIILTKTCQGKVMKEKLKCVKTDFSPFIHHPSFCER